MIIKRSSLIDEMKCDVVGCNLVWTKGCNIEMDQYCDQHFDTNRIACCVKNMKTNPKEKRSEMAYKLEAITKCCNCSGISEMMCNACRVCLCRDCCSNAYHGVLYCGGLTFLCPDEETKRLDNSGKLQV